MQRRIIQTGILLFSAILLGACSASDFWNGYYQDAAMRRELRAQYAYYDAESAAQKNLRANNHLVCIAEADAAQTGTVAKEVFSKYIQAQPEPAFQNSWQSDLKGFRSAFFRHLYVVCMRERATPVWNNAANAIHYYVAPTERRKNEIPN